MSQIETLEQKLGHDFATRDLLARALTHSSRSANNYERLEFLGDRVLGLVVAEWLTEHMPVASEGEMAKRFAGLVSRESLAEVGRDIDLGAALGLSPTDARSGARENPTLIADCCEAVIAALYLDGGLQVARDFIRQRWAGLLDNPPQSGDAKTRLQEWSQGRGLGLPSYQVLDRSGPDHAPQFLIRVTIDGAGEAQSQGASKRVAEREAAEALLHKLTSEA